MPLPAPTPPPPREDKKYELEILPKRTNPLFHVGNKPDPELDLNIRMATLYQIIQWAVPVL